MACFTVYMRWDDDDDDDDADADWWWVVFRSIVGTGLSQFRSRTLNITLPFFTRFRNPEDRRVTTGFVIDMVQHDCVKATACHKTETEMKQVESNFVRSELAA